MKVKRKMSQTITVLITNWASENWKIPESTEMQAKDLTEMSGKRKSDSIEDDVKGNKYMRDHWLNISEVNK